MDTPEGKATGSLEEMIAQRRALRIPEEVLPRLLQAAWAGGYMDDLLEGMHPESRQKADAMLEAERARK